MGGRVGRKTLAGRGREKERDLGWGLIKQSLLLKYDYSRVKISSGLSDEH
jgi:hypothetical protein